MNRDRRLEGETEKLWGFMDNMEVKGQYKIKVPERKNQPQRDALVEVRFSPVRLKSPPKSVVEENVEVNMVYVREVNPPFNVEPLKWMLLTTLSVGNLKEAKEKIDWYRVRWGIESYHKVLKSGCKVEDCKLQTVDRLKRYLTLMTIIAWRIFWMTHLNRNEPDTSCEAILTKHEWQSLYCKSHKSSLTPKTPPNVREVIRWIARLGGFFARKGDGEPGLTTLWRGWHRLNDIAETWLLLHPQKTCG